MRIDISYIKEKINNFRYTDEYRNIYSQVFTPASVLIPVYKKDNILHLLFTKRTEKVRHHKGQISFPGGKFEPEDENLEVTALRETYEEVGIKEEDITIFGQINNMTTITNFIVSPFVGTFPYPYNFIINKDEIDELIEVPVSHLLDKTFFREEIRKINGFDYNIYYYYYNDFIIWGVTGKILFDFLNLLR